MIVRMHQISFIIFRGNVEGEKLYKIGARCSDCGSFDTCPDNALCRKLVLQIYLQQFFLNQKYRK